LAKVNVYDGDKVVGRVEYNNNLDRWDGSNYTSGSTGRHKGITRLRDGRYVLIHGTQWQGEQDSAEVIGAEEALQEILQADCAELLEEARFAELKEIWAETLIEEA
jgi:hypothetical protein